MEIKVTPESLALLAATTQGAQGAQPAGNEPASWLAAGKELMDALQRLSLGKNAARGFRRPGDSPAPSAPATRDQLQALLDQLDEAFSGSP